MDEHDLKGLDFKIFFWQRLEIKKTNKQSQGPIESNQKVTVSFQDFGL